MSQRPIDWQSWQFERPTKGNAMTQQNAAKCPTCESDDKRVSLRPFVQRCGIEESPHRCIVDCPDDWHREPAAPPEGETDHFREVTDMMGKEGKDGKVSAPPEGETNVRSHHHSPDDSSPASADVGGELQAEAAVASPTMSTDQLEKLFCLYTHNPCGTDTWMVGKECQCTQCQRWLERKKLQAYAAALTAEVERLTRECLGRDCDVCGAELPAEKWRQCAACAEQAEAELTRLRELLSKALSMGGFANVTWDIQEAWRAEARAALESTTPQGGQEGKP